MRYQGSLIQWNDERGFGWIAADEGGDKIFVHISAFVPRPHADQRPKSGQRLEFAVGIDKGKKCAQQVAWRSSNMWLEQKTPSARRSSLAARSPQSSRPASGWHASGRFSYGVLLIWLALMLACSMLWSVPAWIWLAYVGLSLLTFMVYWQDKWAAQKGQWRTSEKTLQLLALAGGWPGAVLAQQWLRHKSSKTSFQLQFWFMALLNAVFMLWLLSPYGRYWLG
ncbi:MAG: cold shock and DUF1294 domain-containing protein [Comamonas sp.]|jgi:uncharacterized membrane protein YsdA (DUF1294 family)/cold shock CspA family protein|uniref:cold shock and DUF1294 domain-containing protein n=1 Tax=Comamonas sp. TaxID=34028 RepID=UPI0028378EF1|nr:cold shock and DUF1294 domain-containing protein [Comamonas sp.]MDR0217154.1 cold shock and DUF1294 domain-containing protein [Comamonas sp.]